MDDIVDIWNMTSTVIPTLIGSDDLLSGWYDNQTLINDSISQANYTPPPIVRTRPPICVDYDLKSMRIGVDVLLTIPIAIFGLIGNILAFVVLCNQRHSVSTTLLLQCLAIMDSFVLIMAIPLRSLYIINFYMATIPSYKRILPYLFLILFPVVYITRLICTWLIALLTINRWIAVCRPLHAQRLVTKKITKIQIAVTIIGSIIICLPRFFELVITPYKKFKNHIYYIYIYRFTINFLLMYFLPITILVVLNYKLVTALRYSERDRAVLQQLQPISSLSVKNGKDNNNHHHVPSTPHKSVTLVVVVVTAIFLICNIPALMSQVIYAIEIFNPTATSVRCPGHIISNISNLLITVNSAVNFIIYCVCSRNFRTTFMEMMVNVKLCCCCCRDKGQLKGDTTAYKGMPSTSSRMGLTYFSLTRSRSSTSSYFNKQDKSDHRFSK